MRRALAGAVIAAIALTGCGNTSSGGNATDSPEVDESAVSTPTPTETEDDATGEPSEEASDGDAIEIEIEGDKITPNGERTKVKTGQTITLEVESDRAGELHVHSTPEQGLAFDTGETALELSIDTPGVVDVEEHESGVVVLQLEVS